MHVLRHVGYWKSSKCACQGKKLLHGQTTSTYHNSCLKNLSQKHPTCCNTWQQGGQMRATCCARPTMLRWFGRELKFFKKEEHRAYTEAYSHRAVLSVWFPPPAISKTRHCQVPLRARQMSRNKALCYLPSVLVSNSYNLSLLQKITKTRKPNTSAEPTIEFKSTALLPYVKGLSEQFHRCLQQQGIHADSKSETTLRSHLVGPKDALEPA